MQIITLDSLPRALPPLVATIGFFDGVHLGHCFLINEVRRVAAARGFCPSVVTFPRHPRLVVGLPQDRPLLLSSPEEKLDLLSRAGVDYCLLLPFTAELAGLSARRFMELLRDCFGVRALVVGHDHRFGHDQNETYADYLRHADELHIYMERARAYADGGQTVSSSAIRRLLAEGDVAAAARLLGHPYMIGGRVVEGHQVGRRLGFPTANLRPDCLDKLIPADGAYAAWATTDDGVRRPAMLNIGCRPTVGNGDDRSVEVHLLRFSGNLYGHLMRVELVERLRGEEKFTSLDDLALRLRCDRKVTEHLLTLPSDGAAQDEKTSAGDI